MLQENKTTIYIPNSLSDVYQGTWTTDANGKLTGRAACAGQQLFHAAAVQCLAIALSFQPPFLHAAGHVTSAWSFSGAFILFG